MRRIPWSELVRRGAELPALVGEVVAEVKVTAAGVDAVRGAERSEDPTPETHIPIGR